MNKSNTKRFKNKTVISWKPPGHDVRKKGTIRGFVSAGESLYSRLTNKAAKNLNSKPVDVTFFNRYIVESNTGSYMTPIATHINKTARVAG